MLNNIYLDILQNAHFVVIFFKIFFASGGKGALTPHNQNPADVPYIRYRIQAGQQVIAVPVERVHTTLTITVRQYIK